MIKILSELVAKCQENFELNLRDSSTNSPALPLSFRDGHKLLNTFAVASKLVMSATFSICADLSMRFINPLKAVPGPSSMNRVNPCDNKYRIEFSQSTDDVTCSTSRDEISAALPCGCAVTFEITGTVGEEIFIFASSFCNFNCALAISGE